jgi:hypothetical protein
MEHVFPLSVTIGFHSLTLFVPYAFQQFYMVHHHPNKPIQNNLEHNLENISYGVWHEINPMNQIPKNQ